MIAKSKEPDVQYCSCITTNMEMKEVGLLSTMYSEYKLSFTYSYLFQCPACKEVRIVKVEKPV